MSRSLISGALAVGRVAIGAALIAVPERMGRTWVGPDGTSPGARVMARGQGIRDIVLGLGALGAFGGSRRGWVTAAVAADLGDLGAMLAAGDDIPPGARTGTTVIAAAAAATGVWLALAGDL